MIFSAYLFAAKKIKCFFLNCKSIPSRRLRRFYQLSVISYQLTVPMAEALLGLKY
ncbi:hypothetical protein [Okeania sp. SIO3B5]|uniref:hypothetical protein n=1 Tax=Okeania sp. SIO3B5 TaxID=2607811 RepID=UPI0025DF3598|nr:hypothetical protein [Okeania sp. SIO3B5]